MRAVLFRTRKPNGDCSAMALEWTDPALDDLEDIRDHIGKDSPYYARRFIERIFDAAAALHDQPQMGRLVPEADRQDVRELIFRSYRIIYRLNVSAT